MKKYILGLIVLAIAVPGLADINLTVQDVNGLAAIYYECTDNEIVRAFALDITVDTGSIIGISGFHIGESTAQKQGYGFFPASFRNYLEVDPNTGDVNDWNVENYTPLADVNDAPENTLAGLETDGVTLELGGFWIPDDELAIPGPVGLLCLLELSEKATVSIAPNKIRGGIVLTSPEIKSVEPKVFPAQVNPANKP